MSEEKPQQILLRDYQPFPYHIDSLDLAFDLSPNATLVTATMRISMAGGDVPADLVLDGDELVLKGLALDGESLAAERYDVSETQLIVRRPPGQFTLTIETEIRPSANTKLEGLYVSGGVFCTQCEAEGFRRITFYPDRPDVLTVFKTTIRADKEQYPVLLSNGNLVENEMLEDGRHSAVWHDPFPKPSYLFALVAGDLGHAADTFVTASGREVDLRIYCPHDLESRCAYAMDALKRAMAWDEERYGLEYDLDVFNIVAINDFNMGAMENKSLNIFNAKYILADAETATDDDYAFIESVVAHEYFHNWTGNRVTCRDWFQLSLKEGLTVYRDQEFSADMRSRGVQRIRDVRTLRARQFPEDSGPLAHPVRPESYIEINNFYTATVYDKGAEVIRMMETLLGRDGFRKGMDLYFERHDGQAVTCDDFVAAMADANDTDLTQFKLWYSQAGTPDVTVTTALDVARSCLRITATQNCPSTPGQSTKDPMLIPLRLGLLDAETSDLATRCSTAVQPDGEDGILWAIRDREQTLEISEIDAMPLISVNRGFGAPIIVRGGEESLPHAELMVGETDQFARWEASQQYGTQLLLTMISKVRDDDVATVDPAFVRAWRGVLIDPTLDPGFAAQCLALPSADYLAEQMDEIDVQAIHRAREDLRLALATAWHKPVMERYNRLSTNEPYRPDWQDAGRRALRNILLWVIGGRGEGEPVVHSHYHNADNMTDRMAALGVLNRRDSGARDSALADFHDRYHDDTIVLDKWFAVQAMAPLDDALDRVRSLMEHPAFTIKNPNKVRALIGVFATGNPLAFHAADGSGYRFLAEQIMELDSINPQTAARLLAPLGRWRRFDQTRQGLMREALENIAGRQNLSRDVFEITSKMLEDRPKPNER